MSLYVRHIWCVHVGPAPDHAPISPSPSPSLFHSFSFSLLAIFFLSVWHGSVCHFLESCHSSSVVENSCVTGSRFCLLCMSLESIACYHVHLDPWCSLVRSTFNTRVGCHSLLLSISFQLFIISSVGVTSHCS
ncbi:hypothetical protein Mp_3g18910 [Marchantia polymorpha subsp. ruderalis]|uniref:Uncharacterized protein n=2 Tax=Marchantia polymorpha TaxID=3197 RepID=A0AAF6B2C8_MARPO|nr:hypothetical protein MARPO_0142s0004 [Marchantia polymorpha]BBN06162.1 hypothetical protein Mp_3g18910 [Marchantia polymorpha subsp. ruderalis]|eukprot:PTQ29372.1 hypothetical protein MARPO_0142s0004 [Marchantia polymorpha]